MAKKEHISKELKRLTPKQFEKWFKRRKSLSGTWEKAYKKIGGIIKDAETELDGTS